MKISKNRNLFRGKNWLNSIVREGGQKVNKSKAVDGKMPLDNQVFYFIIIIN